jgi:hypothetical protein
MIQPKRDDREVVQRPVPSSSVNAPSRTRLCTALVTSAWREEAPPGLRVPQMPEERFAWSLSASVRMSFAMIEASMQADALTDPRSASGAARGSLRRIEAESRLGGPASLRGAPVKSRQHVLGARVASPTTIRLPGVEDVVAGRACKT